MNTDNPFWDFTLMQLHTDIWLIIYCAVATDRKLINE